VVSASGRVCGYSERLNNRLPSYARDVQPSQSATQGTKVDKIGSMRLVLRLLLLVVSAYVFMWGATWLAGDRSYMEFGPSRNGGSWVNYPGVLFGGLPPVPGFDSDLPMLLAVLAGATGTLVWVVSWLRRRNVSN